MWITSLKNQPRFLGRTLGLAQPEARELLCRLTKEHDEGKQDSETEQDPVDLS